jgi:hypothetical protein
MVKIEGELGETQIECDIELPAGTPIPLRWEGGEIIGECLRVWFERKGDRKVLMCECKVDEEHFTTLREFFDKLDEAER